MSYRAFLKRKYSHHVIASFLRKNLQKFFHEKYKIMKNFKENLRKYYAHSLEF